MNHLSHLLQQKYRDAVDAEPSKRFSLASAIRSLIFRTATQGTVHTTPRWRDLFSDARDSM